MVVVKQLLLASASFPLATAKPKHVKQVLVIDDHAIVRNALRDILESQADDFSVEGEAADGKAAIQHFPCRINMGSWIEQFIRMDEGALILSIFRKQSKT
jgi:hypothetical protein